MTTAHTVSVPRPTVDPDALAYFRFGQLNDGIILTNEAGQWQHLPEETFRAFLAGTLDAEDDAYADLSAKGFLREPLSLDLMADLLRRRKRPVGLGPTVHDLDLGAADAPLKLGVAKEVLDHIMLSTAGALHLRFDARAAHPPADTVAFLVQYATEKNRYEGKTLTYELIVSDAALSPELREVVFSKNFTLRLDATTIDQLAPLTDLHAAWDAKRKPSRAVVTARLGADTLSADWVGAASAAGVKRLQVVPAATLDAAAFGSAYATILSAALTAGLVEEQAALVVARATATDDPAHALVRSPTGIGTTLLAYSTAGGIYPSPEARSLHAEGDDIFFLGTVGEVSYKDTISHPTLRSLTMASLLECLPGFQDRWSTPYCGIDPVASYIATGDLFPTAPTSSQANAAHAVAEAVFAVLAGDDTAAREALEQYASA